MYNFVFLELRKIILCVFLYFGVLNLCSLGMKSIAELLGSAKKIHSNKTFINRGKNNGPNQRLFNVNYAGLYSQCSTTDDYGVSPGRCHQLSFFETLTLYNLSLEVQINIDLVYALYLFLQVINIIHDKHHSELINTFS